MIVIGKGTGKRVPGGLRPAQDRWVGRWYGLLFGCVYFIAVCLCASDVIKVAALVLSAAALLLAAVRRRVLLDRLYHPALALILVLLMDGISTFYAISGKFALREFLKVMAAFDLGLILLSLSPRGEKQTGRVLMTILAVCGALGSLISIDLLSTHWLSGAVLGFFGLFTEEYKWLGGVEAGVRMTSMFTNPNIFAGYSGIGVLLSLGLAMTAEERRERCFSLVLLFLNALAFILAFSLGASAFIAAAFLVFLLMQPGEKRGSALLLMLETLTPVALFAALISATSFESWSGVQPIPLLCAVVGAAVLCFLDAAVQRWAKDRLGLRGKAVPALLIALLLLLTAYLCAGWSLTGPAELAPGDLLRRALYLKPGEYALELDGEGDMMLLVESQNRRETMMHTSTVLYWGGTEDAAFTVPEDSLVQYFNFSSDTGARISSASCGGIKLPLHYKLLPGFIANRLQGLLANQNAIQRLVFFEDGMKLFRRSPVFGLGMGAYENGIKSVQSFYYETKYAHDHYIQVLVETGVVGLALFLCLLLTGAVAIWKARKTQPFAPTLGAALVFMAGHAAVEVVFSTYAYLPMAFGVFILIDLCCGESLARPKLKPLVRSIALALTAVFLFVYSLLVICNLAAKNLIQRQPTLDSVSQAVSLDKFEWADYALAYVTNTMDDDMGMNVRVQADAYAERLSRVNSNTIPIYLAQYYFRTDRMDKAFAMLEKYVDYVASDATAWQNAFDLARQMESDNPVYRAGISGLIRKLDDWNAVNLGSIQMDPEMEAFLDKYRTA